MKKLILPLIIGSALFSQALQAAEQQRTVSYFTSWGVQSGDEEYLQASKADTLLLSFGKWDSNGKIETSDGIASVPAYDASWYTPAYLAWTQAKLAQPNKKVMVAFGGQTYENIWSSLATADGREKVAQGLMNLLNTGYPVYKKNLTPGEMQGPCLSVSWDDTCNMQNYQKAGTVYLDGVDFDFEKAARLTEKENDDLLQLVQRLRELLGPNSHKLISLTTYHVGSDPVNCSDNTIFDNCSYIESQRSSHYGEVLPLLQKGSHLFDFFNVMTYDAGRNFLYKVAMNNFANAIGDKSKILVGTTINQQWAAEGNFVETKTNNIARAEWQAANNFGGFFVWTLGSNSEQMKFADQVAYINEMREAAENVSPGSDNQIPTAVVRWPEVIIGAAEKVTFDGSGSVDPEGAALTYRWEQLDGPAVTLANHDQAQTWFALNNPASDQTLRFRLTVNDGVQDSRPVDFAVKHQVEQSASDQLPVAVINAPKEVISGMVTLDGSGSSAAENAMLSYHWKQTSGTPVTLLNTHQAKAQFTVNKISKDEPLTFSLVVNDGKQDSAVAKATILHKAQGETIPDSLPTWVLGHRYQAGDKVQGRDGNRYQCRGENREAWCGMADAYEPGIGWAWPDAWTPIH